MNMKLVHHQQAYTIEHITTNHMVKRKGIITKRHRHPVFHLIYITAGCGVFEINDQIKYASPGMLYVIQPNEWHAFGSQEGHFLSDLECTFTLMDQQGGYAQSRLFDMPSVYPVPGHLQTMLIEGFERVLEASTKLFSPDHIGVLIMDLMFRIQMICNAGDGRADSPPDTKEALVDQLKQYLKAHLSSPIRLTEVASSVHLSPNYVCRIFKQMTGETLMDYLLRIRMQEACKLLIYTDLPIYAIAEKVSYEDASYFSRIFKKKQGVSPQDYRARMQ